MQLFGKSIGFYFTVCVCVPLTVEVVENIEFGMCIIQENIMKKFAIMSVVIDFYKIKLNAKSSFINKVFSSFLSL